VPVLNKLIGDERAVLPLRMQGRVDKKGILSTALVPKVCSQFPEDPRIHLCNGIC
jgi:hypothetical protein